MMNMKLLAGVTPLSIYHNDYTYNYLGNSLLEEITDDICVKPSMASHSYKVVNTNSYEISGWTILSRLLHSRTPNFGGMNGDFQSDITTLVFNGGEQLEDFHSTILILQQEIIFFRETVSPTRLIFQ